MARIVNLAKWILQNFGPLIVFMVAKNLADLKTAIFVTIIWAVIEVAYLLGIKKERPTQFFWFTFGTTMLFGVIDLNSDNPILFRYESVVNNVLTGLYFGATVFIGKPLIQEFAEKASTEPITHPGRLLYLRYLTIAWTAYFFVKATIYFYIARSELSFETATAIRSALGPISIAAMIAGERILRPITIKILRRLKLLPDIPPPSSSPEVSSTQTSTT